MSVKEGDVVHLLDKCDKQVGIGSILGGSRLHGNELPSNFVKIAVKEINADVRPWCLLLMILMIKSCLPVLATQ